MGGGGVRQEARRSQFLDGRREGCDFEYDFNHDGKVQFNCNCCLFSVHKDPYENIYCVVRGYKDFILHPPSDLPWLYYREFEPAVYERLNGKLQPVPAKSLLPVPWISVDPLLPDSTKHPLYSSHSTPVRCRVEAGDVLYLPSLWFHHLRQSHGCVAVNFWYGMEFDAKYTYFNFIKSVDTVRAKFGGQ